MTTKQVPISHVQIDPHNPRTITKEKFQELKQSIIDFPEMQIVKPLIVADGLVIGGNMRLLAMKDLGYKEVYINDVTEWSQAKRDEFMIKDNSHYGSWNYDTLANEWDVLPLQDWGLDIWKEMAEEAVNELKDKGLKIDFNPDDYDTAHELVTSLKNLDFYVGGLVLEALRKQFK
tara:strand:+ start:734 stop:1258 length:525 start_codon:yes stop_codon:yes gene_type:complete